MSITITFRIALVATALCAIPSTAVQAGNLPTADDETAIDGEDEAAAPDFDPEGAIICSRAFLFVADDPDLIDDPVLRPELPPDLSEEDSGELIDVERPED